MIYNPKNHIVKIPTLLGLAILIAAIISGVVVVSTNQLLTTRAGISANPKNINLVNLSATHASVYWQTDEDVPGFIQAGPSKQLGLTFRDERDQNVPTNHQLHFVTLTRLTPNTTYYYKIGSGASTYPPGQPLSFKTTALSESSNLPPVIGQVIDSSFQPVKEAIIDLEIPNAPKLSTVTKMAGNFILPLSEISLPASQSARLTIFNLQQQSQATILIPSPNLLPPIVLGEDQDLTRQATPTPAPTIDADLNRDGTINSLDRSILLQNLGKKPKNIRADLNRDGIVDQKDVDIINKLLPGGFSR